MDTDFATQLLNSAKESRNYREAGITSAAVRQPEMRSDSIRWIEPATATTTEKVALAWLDEIREALRQYFRIHIEQIECHFSKYQPGQFYVRHRDTGPEQKRLFSFVIYLNPNWMPGDGGELRGYNDQEVLFEIQPKSGTMILFKSDIEHEVLTSNCERFALTGWFRR